VLAERAGMPEWLESSFSSDQSHDAATVATRLALAALAGVLVGMIYRFSHGRESRDASALFTTIVLLSVLIAMVTMVIGNSVARAFSLVGALSIVRFRTAVDDTRDTAFVIFTVVVGMAVGTGLLLVPLIGIPLVGVTALMLSAAPVESRESRVRYVLTVRLASGTDPDAEVVPAIKVHGEDIRLISSATSRQGASVDLVWHLRLRAEGGLPRLVAVINECNGVQSVELREMGIRAADRMTPAS